AMKIWQMAICWRGTRPTRAAKCRPFLNSEPSPTPRKAGRRNFSCAFAATRRVEFPSKLLKNSIAGRFLLTLEQMIVDCWHISPGGADLKTFAAHCLPPDGFIRLRPRFWGCGGDCRPRR